MRHAEHPGRHRVPETRERDRLDDRLAGGGGTKQLRELHLEVKAAKQEQAG